MPDDTTYDRLSITVDGTALADTVMTFLDEIVIEDDLAQPAMFTLQFHDPQFTLIDGTTFKLGSEVMIKALNPNNQNKVLLTAEITSLEPVLEQRLTMFVIRGYDLSHRLYRGSKSRTFLKMTDSGIASKIAQEAGLQADVTATSGQFEYVVQDNQTDMEFLRERAARIGYRVRADGKKLVYKSAETSPPTAATVTWNTNLLSFRSRVNGVGQPNSVEVRGWSPTTKQAIVGQATTATVTNVVGDGKAAGAAAQTAFGSAAKVLVTTEPVDTQTEANALAKAVLDHMSGNYVYAEGFCYGEPAIKAGTMVQVAGIGTKYSGKYFVTATRHTYSNAEGYRTTFIVNGKRPLSMVSSLDAANRQHGYAGVVIGIVTNNNDPNKQGRVKVKFPWLNDQEESDWARVASAGAGKAYGFQMVPEVNDEVLVAFEHGDMRRPYVVGGLWNGRDAPPLTTAVANGKVKTRMLKTRNGHELSFVDDEGAGKGMVQIKTAAGLLVTVSDTAKKIELKSASHTVLLDDQGRAVKITSGGDVEIGGPGGKLKIAAGGVELTSTSGVKVQGNSTVQVTANASLQLQGNAMAELKSSGILTVQGTLVKIN